MKLALFDFDGTITKRDTMLPFLIHSRGLLFFFVCLPILIPVLTAYFLRLLSAHSAKETIMRFYFKNFSTDQLEKKGAEFMARRIPSLLRKEVVDKFELAIKEGQTVCIVTASCTPWIKPFCEKYAVKYICTEFEFNKNRFTGKFRTPNCKGVEKKKRILEMFDPGEFSIITAYGNAPEDLPMMELANERNIIR